MSAKKWVLGLSGLAAVGTGCSTQEQPAVTEAKYAADTSKILADSTDRFMVAEIKKMNVIEDTLHLKLANVLTGDVEHYSFSVDEAKAIGLGVSPAHPYLIVDRAHPADGLRYLENAKEAHTHAQDFQRLGDEARQAQYGVGRISWEEAVASKNRAKDNAMKKELATVEKEIEKLKPELSGEALAEHLKQRKFTLDSLRQTHDSAQQR